MYLFKPQEKQTAFKHLKLSTHFYLRDASQSGFHLPKRLNLKRFQDGVHVVFEIQIRVFHPE